MSDNYNDVELNVVTNILANTESFQKAINELAMPTEKIITIEGQINQKNINKIASELSKGVKKATSVEVNTSNTGKSQITSSLKLLKKEIQNIQIEADTKLKNAYTERDKGNYTEYGTFLKDAEEQLKILRKLIPIYQKLTGEQLPNFEIRNFKINTQDLEKSINKPLKKIKRCFEDIGLEFKAEIEDTIINAQERVKKTKTSTKSSTKVFDNGNYNDELAQNLYSKLINKLSKQYEEQQKKLRNDKYDWDNVEQTRLDLNDYYETKNLLKLLMDKTGIKSVKKDIENNIPKIDNDKLSRNQRDIIDRAFKNNISEKKINEIENEVAKIFENNEKVVQLINKVIGIQDEATNYIINDLGKYASETSKQAKFSQDENLNSDNINKKIKALSTMLNDYEDFYDSINGINEDNNELSKNEKLLQQSGQEIIELYTAVQKYIDSVGDIPPLSSNIIDQIENVNNDLNTLNQKQNSVSSINNNGNNEIEAKNNSSMISNNNSKNNDNINNIILSEDVFTQIQKELNKLDFTIYISHALLSENFKSEELQKELDNALAANPIKVDVSNTAIPNDSTNTQVSNNVSINISKINLNNEEAIKDIKSRIETALSPIFIEKIEINQENIDNIKDQIKKALYTFTIDKIEFNPEIDIDKISNQINTMLSSVQMPLLDYTPNAKALKTELENALAQVTMPNDSVSSLVPNNTVNDLEAINKMSTALENLKRAIDSINRSITRMSQNIENRNSGIVKNMEADMSKLQNLIDQVDKLKQSIDSIGKIKNIVVTIQNTNNNSLSDKGSKASNTDKKRNNTSASANSIDFARYHNIINNKISELNKAVEAGDINKTFAKKCITWLNNLKKGISEIEKGKESVNYKKLTENDTFKDFKLESQNIRKEIISVWKTINTDTKANTIANYYNAIDKDIKEIEKAKVKIGTQTGNDYISKLNTFKEAFKKFQNGNETVEFGEGANKELLDLTQTIKRYKELITEIQNDKFDATVETSLNKVERNYNSLISKVREWGQENSRALKDKHIAAQYNKILSELSNTTDISAEKTERLSAAFNRLNAQALAAGKTGRSFSGEMKHLFNILGDRAIVGSALEYLKDGFREMLNNTREIDAAMTELKKVTDNSSGRYAQFLKEAGTEAKNLGSTIANVVSSTAGFAKLGYNINESQTLAENAVMYSNVGDLDIETATNDLVSATKAFGLSAEDTGKIVDSFNEVGNRFAVSAKQLGEGLTNSASTLAMSGNSMDESIAMLTAMTEVTQDASSAGAALKIFALRVRGAKTELNEMGEDTSDMATSTSKLRDEIKGLTGGFDIMTDDTTFKSTMKIAEGLSEAMEKMNDIDRTALLEKVAGKNRANQIGALLDNFSQAKKALEVSKDSAGSAAKENAAYIDSIQGRINQMKAAFEDLSIDFFDSEDIKIVIQGLTKVIELVDKIVEATGGGPLLAFGLTSFMRMRGDVDFEKLFDGSVNLAKATPAFLNKGKNAIGKGLKNTGLHIIDYVTKAVMELKDAGEDVTDIFDMLYEDTGRPIFKNLSQELRELENSKNKAGEVANAVNKIGANAQTSGEEISENIGENLQETLENAVEAGGEAADAVEDVGEAAGGAGKGVAALGAGFKALLVQLAISAIIWAISAIADSIETVEKLEEKVEEVSEEYQNVVDKLEDVNSQLEENKKKIEEINSNPLTITSKEDLERLQEENALLEAQKRGLEFTEKSKARELAKAATEFLNKRGYSYSEEKGVEEHKWFGEDSYLKAAKKAANDYSVNIDKFKSIDYTKDVEKNIETYTSLVNLIQLQEDYLTDVINNLSEQKQYLNENSEEYKEISKILSTITDKQKEFYDFTSNSPIVKTIAAYTEQNATFTEDLQKYFDEIKEFDEPINFAFEQQVSPDDISEKIKNILTDNNFKIHLVGDISEFDVQDTTYRDALNAYKQIIKLEQEESTILSEQEDFVKQTLKNIVQLPDLPLEQIFDIIELIEFQSKIEEFFKIPDDEFEDFSDVNAEKYYDFKQKLLEKLPEDDKESMDGYLSSIFPSYQDINNWLTSYYNEGNFDIVNELTEKVLSGEDIDWNNDDYNIIKNAFLAMFNAENIDDIEDKADYFINNLNNRLNKKLSENQTKSQEIEFDFNQKKYDFDGNANPTLSMFESAINSAQAAFGNQATVAYEDMWTMIQTDESLVDSFTKTANGYTVSVDALREAKERYIKTVKNGFEEDRQNALSLIKDAEARKSEAENILYTIDANGEKIANPNTSDKAKSDARKTIQEENKVIAEQEVVLAKVNLQLEEVNGQAIDYANTLDEITSKLSSWESVYQSILNDMSKINKLSSSTLQAIMKAAPNNWQDMIYLDDNNKIQADKQKVFEFANQDLVNNVKTKQNNLNDSFSEQVNSAFKSKYGIDLGVDLELTGDYEKDLEDIKKRVSEAIGKADYRQLSTVEGGINVNETLEELTPNIEDASEGVKIFTALLEALFGEFEENKALTNFNSDIEKLQHSFSMGNINQTQYNSAYASKVSEFENAVRADGSIGTVETQDQLNQMYETIHSNQQSELNKLLEKEKQSIQDAYDQRLITAEQYYSQLAALEAKYYGTKDSKGLLDDPDGTNVEEALREQVERRRELYNDEKSLLQDKYDKGFIDFNTFESELNRLKNEWLNIPELKVTFDEEVYDNTNTLYDAELANIEQLSEENKLTNTQTAAEMRRIWEKYYKDKKGFAKESYEAEKRYLEAAKNDIQDQINGIEDLININSDFIDRQTKILEDQNDKITKAYDEQINLIDKQIDTINEQIDAIQDKADEEDRYYQIQKNEENLRNSSQRTRMVYGSDGTISYRVDTEKQQEALKNYNDAKKDLVIAELEKQKDEKEKEKESLEEAKEAALEINNTKIEELNTTLNGMNKPLEDLVTILSANLAETYGIDPEVIQSILQSDASKLALDQMNKAKEAQGEETTTAEELVKVGEQASEAYQNQTVSQATKDEQINEANENITENEGNIIKVGEGLYEVLGDLPLKELNSNLAALLSSNIPLPNGTSMLSTVNNSMLDNTLNPKIVNAGTENMIVTGQQPINVTTGDIVIHSPVGNSNDLAKELRLNLQNAFEKQMYSNLK